METVSQRLDSPKLNSQQRMALLRRQAELGDLRDALAERARGVPSHADAVGGTMAPREPGVVEHVRGGEPHRQPRRAL